MSIRVAHPRKRFRDHHPVVAGQHPRDLLVVAPPVLGSCSLPPDETPTMADYTRPIGSGSAGLGIIAVRLVDCGVPHSILFWKG